MWREAGQLEGETRQGGGGMVRMDTIRTNLSKCAAVCAPTCLLVSYLATHQSAATAGGRWLHRGGQPGRTRLMGREADQLKGETRRGGGGMVR